MLRKSDLTYIWLNGYESRIMVLTIDKEAKILPSLIYQPEPSILNSKEVRKIKNESTTRYEIAMRLGVNDVSSGT